MATIRLYRVMHTGRVGTEAPSFRLDVPQYDDAIITYEAFLKAQSRPWENLLDGPESRAYIAAMTDYTKRRKDEHVLDWPKEEIWL